MDDLFDIPSGVGIGGVFEPLEESFVEGLGGFGEEAGATQGHDRDIKQASGAKSGVTGVEESDQKRGKIGLPCGEGEAKQQSKGCGYAGGFGVIEDLLEGGQGLFKGEQKRGGKAFKGR